jgi:hypothetical protein
LYNNMPRFVKGTDMHTSQGFRLRGTRGTPFRSKRGRRRFVPRLSGRQGAEG